MPGQNPHKHPAEQKQLLSNSARVNGWFLLCKFSQEIQPQICTTVLQNPAENYSQP